MWARANHDGISSNLQKNIYKSGLANVFQYDTFVSSIISKRDSVADENFEDTVTNEGLVLMMQEQLYLVMDRSFLKCPVED